MVETDHRNTDLRRRYCRRLGHEVPFRYCRLTADGRACSSILGCWQNNAEIAPLAAKAAELAAPPAGDKRLQLAELIRRARET
jgi:hypothetical protein